MNLGSDYMHAMKAECRYSQEDNRFYFKIMEIIEGKERVENGYDFFTSSKINYPLIKKGNTKKLQEETLVLSFDLFEDPPYNLTANPYRYYFYEKEKEAIIQVRGIEEWIKMKNMFKEDVENKTNTPILNENAENLCQKNYPYHPAITREEELKQVILKLIQNKSVLLIGHAGVGKTAIAEGLAYQIKKGAVPDLLKEKVIYEISINTLLAGTRYRGTFEEKVKEIIKETKANPQIILFIDEMHEAIGAGRSESQSLDLANILKPALGRREITIIGSTTEEEYETFILKDTSFKSRFAKIKIEEPTLEKTRTIVFHLLPHMEEKYHVSFENVNDIDFLIAMSYKRKTSEMEYNPRLVLNILEDAFALAYLKGQKVITFDDVVEAISMCLAISNVTLSSEIKGRNKPRMRVLE